MPSAQAAPPTSTVVVALLTALLGGSILLNVFKDYRQKMLNVQVMLTLRRTLFERLLHLPLAEAASADWRSGAISACLVRSASAPRVLRATARADSSSRTRPDRSGYAGAAVFGAARRMDE